MKQITHYDSFAKINKIFAGTEFEPISHSNHKVNAYKKGFGGFWKNKTNEKVIYISTDLLDKKVLIRTAKNNKDFTGGFNNYAATDEQLLETARKLTK